MTGAALFEWLAGRGFYAQLHHEAAALLPDASSGENWTDVGCGPGLMTRIAATKGYDAAGFDSSASMITAARRISRGEGSSATFDIGTAGALPTHGSSVVSAVSLLAVVPDPAGTLRQLWAGVAPGGRLLVVEPTARMEPRRARTVVDRSYTGADRLALSMWSAARAGRSVDVGALGEFGTCSRVPLLSGLVAAWVFARPGTAAAASSE